MQSIGPVSRQVLKYAAGIAVAVPTLIAVSGAANGSGFALREQSGSAMGNAFAGATAGAEDISYMFFNPAGLTRHSGNQTSFGVTYISPSSELTGSSGSTVLNTAISGSTTSDDVGVNGLLPVTYGFFDLHPDFKAAIAINVPFGLETDYEADWVGRYHALNSKMLTVNVNPAVAYRVNDWLSLGAGVQVNYIDVSLTNAVDFGT
ncbi:MAG: transporter, partial [Alphaproteobacteria bacterium]|nr:transporter [Alphaproteobacteria bacterium]